MKVVSKSEKSTQDILKEVLKTEHNIFILNGELGSGKTTFTKGLEDLFKIKVKSPTFDIMKVYDINDKKYKKLYHLDCYRIKDFKGLDLEFKEDNLYFIEWGDNVKKFLPKKYLNISFKYIDKNIREITYEE